MYFSHIQPRRNIHVGRNDGSTVYRPNKFILVPRVPMDGMFFDYLSMNHNVTVVLGDTYVTRVNEVNFSRRPGQTVKYHYQSSRGETEFCLANFLDKKDTPNGYDGGFYTLDGGGMVALATDNNSMLKLPYSTATTPIGKLLEVAEYLVSVNCHNGVSTAYKRHEHVRVIVNQLTDTFIEKTNKGDVVEQVLCKQYFRKVPVMENGTVSYKVVKLPEGQHDELIEYQCVPLVVEGKRYFIKIRNTSNNRPLLIVIGPNYTKLIQLLAV